MREGGGEVREGRGRGKGEVGGGMREEWGRDEGGEWAREGRERGESRQKNSRAKRTLAMDRFSWVEVCTYN